MFKAPRAWVPALAAILGTLIASSMVVTHSATARTRTNHGPDKALLALERSSHKPIQQSTAWEAYDEAPASQIVRPVNVLDVTGEVSDPTALTNPAGGQVMTLTYPVGGTEPSVVLDYGRDVGGVPQFTFASGAGVITTSYTETLKNLGDDGATSVTLFESGNGTRSDTFEAAGAGTRQATLISGGERYEEVKLTTPGTVSISAAGINFSANRETPAVMATEGHFLSSDPLLNRIWYAGAYTLNLVQLPPNTPVDDGQINESHLLLDGAKRDRGVWSGDQTMEDLTDFYASDPAYVRDSLALLLSHPASSAGELSPAAGSMSKPGPFPGVCTPNPAANNVCLTWSASYSLVLMPALYNYYLYTGDLAFVRSEWPAIERQMDWYAEQVDSHGLFAVTSSDATDWNLESPTGETTYNNALYVEALNSASKLAAAIGDTPESLGWANNATSVAAAVNRTLWDSGTGLYDSSNTQRGDVVQDANVMAILSGIATGTRALDITKILASNLATPYGPDAANASATGYVRDISPFMGGFNAMADFAVGDQTAALALIRQEWGYMINHDPGGVDWERIEPNGIPAGTSGSLAIADSSAHGWSTGPTAALSQYVLGVSPSSPGYANWSVAPQLGNLAWAQGVVPTPHGRIQVAWKRAADNRSFTLTVTSPAGETGTVTVPLLGASRTIARNGHIVWSSGRPARGVNAHSTGTTVVFAQPAGTSTYAWAANTRSAPR